MLWARNTSKPVRFTPETADQNLLADVEQVLAKNQYENFSDLCKQALWQFLLQSASTQSNPNSPEPLQQLAGSQRQNANLGKGGVFAQSSVEKQLESPLVAELQRKIVELEHRVKVAESSRKEHLENQHEIDIQRKFTELEHRVSVAESRRFEQLENQLLQLSEKFQQLLEIQVNQGLAIETPLAGSNQSVARNTEPQVQKSEPIPNDEVLNRLGSMLDDF
jgi:hypothetical protein